jgi:hypothetical protein
VHGRCLSWRVPLVCHKIILDNDTTMESIMNLVTCTACGKEFAFVLEMRGQGQCFMLTEDPLRIRHCEHGNYVDIFGKLTAFYEKVDGALVEARPILSDPLESQASPSSGPSANSAATV